MAEPTRLGMAINPVYAELQAAYVARFSGEGAEPMQVGLLRMTRAVELVNYAEHHGISVEQAIVDLVNQGLSYVDRSYR